MRVVKQNAPGDPVNNGVVVFHAGANVARRWEDFQSYSEADQEFFDQLLPIEDLDFSIAEELEAEPVISATGGGDQVQVRSQTDVRLQEIPLLEDDAEAVAALLLLQGKGYTSVQVSEAFDALRAVPVTKARARQAKRHGLSEMERNAAGKVLKQRKVNPGGKSLDPTHQKTNLVFMISAIARLVNKAVGKRARQRSEFSRPELDKIEGEFNDIVSRATEEVFGAK